MGIIDYLLVLVPLACITEGMGLPMWCTAIVAIAYYLITVFSPIILGIIFTMIVWIAGMVFGTVVYGVKFALIIALLFLVHLFITVKIFGKRRRRF